MVQEDVIVPKTWFEQWRSPHEFYRKADDCMSQFEPDIILGMTGVQHLFDAHVAGLFARVWNDHHACKVKLEPGDFPDAHLRDAKDTLALEVTMADEKDRRMAAEHRRSREMRERGESAVIHTNWEQERENAQEAIPRVCAKKVKRYLGSDRSDGQVPAHLLIYVNFFSYADPVLTDEEMIELTEQWQYNFPSIWLLCGARIVRTWPSPKVMCAVNNPID